MIFSKSFGYALRGVLYVARETRSGKKVSLDEIAGHLRIPRYFLAKILVRVAKAGIIDSSKGPSGGFFVNNKTLGTQLLTIVLLTEGTDQFKLCVLQLRKCNARKPCPLHHQMEKVKNQLLELFSVTTIGDLLKRDDPDFINSLAIN
ncbi:MAG TPA: Rrf2 family transcriptional regulator [Chitinophagaceae bacterium]|nr:Rrf2 family transcriptional regulator [Chitinophagaceae bacterium]